MSHRRRAILLSLGLNAAAQILSLGLMPLHARGIAQTAGGFFLALADVVQFPGLAGGVLLRFLSLPLGPAATWLFPTAINLVFYGTLFFLLIGTPKLPAPADPQRRRLLRAGLRLAALPASAAFGYSFFIEPLRLRVTRTVIAIRNLPGQLDGLVLVQLTDIHHGPWLPVWRLQEIVARANALEGDLVVLTGDYVHRSAAYIPAVAKALGRLKAKIGVVGVLGNHDWNEDGPLAQQALAAAGIRMLDNTRLILTPERQLVRQGETGLCIAGVGDYWRHTQDYGAALGDLPSSMPRLLLSHNPDTAEEEKFTRSGHRVDLMICGHTHGGQIWTPGRLTAAIGSRHNSKYAYGLVQGPTCPVFISSGLGMAILPFRLGCVPEIAVIELRRNDE